MPDTSSDIGNSGSAYSCGSRATVVGPNGSEAITLYCKRWTCPNCRKRNIEKYEGKIWTMFRGIIIHVAFMGLVGCDFRRWKRVNIKKEAKYLCIPNDNGTYVISDRAFEGSRRCNKWKFLEVTLPQILSEYMPGQGRISGRRSGNSTERTASRYYGLLPGDLSQEYNRLRTPFERARWMNCREGFRLFPEGRELLRQYLMRELEEG